MGNRQADSVMLIESRDYDSDIAATLKADERIIDVHGSSAGLLTMISNGHSLPQLNIHKPHLLPISTVYSILAAPRMKGKVDI